MVGNEALDKIIGALIEMREKLTVKRKHDKFMNAKVQLEIVRRYLKGIEIKDLSQQFGCDEKMITNLLIQNNVEIVSHKVPKYNRSRWRKSSK